jgi:hypothetical protein
MNLERPEYFLKRDPGSTGPSPTVDANATREHARPFQRIRCPLCFWTPKPTSRWHCICFGTPEPYFDSCGTVWNTFDTRGRCPGCAHEEWYEQRVADD